METATEALTQSCLLGDSGDDDEDDRGDDDVDVDEDSGYDGHICHGT